MYTANDEDVTVTGTVVKTLKQIYGDNHAFIKSVLLSSSIIRTVNNLINLSANATTYKEEGIVTFNHNNDTISLAYRLFKDFSDPFITNTVLKLNFLKTPILLILQSPILAQIYSGAHGANNNIFGFNSGLETIPEGNTTIRVSKLEHKTEDHGPLDFYYNNPTFSPILDKLNSSNPNYSTFLTILNQI